MADMPETILVLARSVHGDLLHRLILPRDSTVLDLKKELQRCGGISRFRLRIFFDETMVSDEDVLEEFHVDSLTIIVYSAPFESNSHFSAELSRAAHFGEVHKIERLLNVPLQPDVLDTPWRLSPLQIAAQAGHVEAVEMLSQAGASFDRPTPLRPPPRGNSRRPEASWSWPVLWLRWICGTGDRAPWQIYSEGGLAPLFDAVVHGDLEMVHTLCELGADFHKASQPSHVTPLCAALECGHFIIARYLHRSGGRALTWQQTIGLLTIPLRSLLALVFLLAFCVRNLHDPERSLHFEAVCWMAVVVSSVDELSFWRAGYLEKLLRTAAVTRGLHAEYAIYVDMLQSVSQRQISGWPFVAGILSFACLTLTSLSITTAGLLAFQHGALNPQALRWPTVRRELAVVFSGYATGAWISLETRDHRMVQRTVAGLALLLDVLWVYHNDHVFRWAMSRCTPSYIFAVLRCTWPYRCSRGTAVEHCVAEPLFSRRQTGDRQTNKNKES